MTDTLTGLLIDCALTRSFPDFPLRKDYQITHKIINHTPKGLFYQNAYIRTP